MRSCVIKNLASRVKSPFFPDYLTFLNPSTKKRVLLSRFDCRFQAFDSEERAKENIASPDGGAMIGDKDSSLFFLRSHVFLRVAPLVWNRLCFDNQSFCFVYHHLQFNPENF